MIFRIILLFCLCAFSFFVFSKKNEKTTVIVQGHVTCDGKPLRGVTIKFVNEKKWAFDPVFDKVKTHGDGSFYLKGKFKNLKASNPKVKLWHKCFNKTKNIFKKLCYYQYSPTLTNGEYIDKSFGNYMSFTLEVKLNTKKKSGKRDCFFWGK